MEDLEERVEQQNALDNIGFMYENGVVALEQKDYTLATQHLRGMSRIAIDYKGKSQTVYSLALLNVQDFASDYRLMLKRSGCSKPDCHKGYLE